MKMKASQIKSFEKFLVNDLECLSKLENQIKKLLFFLSPRKSLARFSVLEKCSPIWGKCGMTDPGQKLVVVGTLKSTSTCEKSFPEHFLSLFCRALWIRKQTDEKWFVKVYCCVEWMEWKSLFLLSDSTLLWAMILRFDSLNFWNLKSLSFFLISIVIFFSRLFFSRS